MSIPTLGVYEHLVHELGGREARGVVMLGCTRQIARLALPGGPLALILRHRTDEPTATRDTLLRALEDHPRGQLEVVAAGGSGGREALQAVVLGKSRRISLHAIDDEGEVWSQRSKVPRTLKGSLDEVSRRPGKLRLDARQFDAWLQERAKIARETVEKIHAYQQFLFSKKPWATRVLIAVTVAVFGLELLWGGATVPNLVRMGAVVGDGPHALELWRPISCGFLHGSLMHLLGNMLVLGYLGGFLERLIGPWRLLTLWLVSVVGGSVAAMALSEASVMVGASGGGWGLMVAAGVIALRPGGLIPQPMAAPMRQSIGRVLFLNLLISFVPGIALSAHLGGGAAGGLMALLGMATAGMQPSTQAATAPGRDPLAGVVRVAGVLSAALLAGALVVGIVQGRPWESVADGPWVEHSLDLPGATLSLPAAFGEGRTERVGEGVEEQVYGDLLTSPFVVTVRTAPFQKKALTTLRLFREYRTLKKSLLEGEPPEGFERVGEPEEAEVGKWFALTERFTVERGRAVRRTVIVPTGAVIVTVLEAADSEPVADRVLAGLATGYEPADSE